MQQRGRTALFAKRKEGDPQVNNRMRDLQVITNIENEAQLLDLASTSSFARAGSPKGVVMVVLYMSLMGDTDALAELTELAEAFPDCNFARVCKEFSKGPELIRARMVEDLPSWEVIAEGKRLSLTAGAGGAGRAEALRRLAEYGFSAARPLSRVVTFDLASPLGWRRDTASLEVTFLKPGGQAEATGQGEWVVGGWVGTNVRACVRACVHHRWEFGDWLGGWLVSWLDGWLAGWLAGWLDGWMDGWMDG